MSDSATPCPNEAGFDYTGDAVAGERADFFGAVLGGAYSWSTFLGKSEVDAR